MSDHAWDLDIEEVWYFVESNVVRRHLKKVAEGYNSVRIFSVPADVTAGLPQELGFAWCRRHLRSKTPSCHLLFRLLF